MSVNYIQLRTGVHDYIRLFSTEIEQGIQYSGYCVYKDKKYQDWMKKHNFKHEKKIFELYLEMCAERMIP